VRLIQEKLYVNELNSDPMEFVIAGGPLERFASE
jgi:hypothetical protein